MVLPHKIIYTRAFIRAHTTGRLFCTFMKDLISNRLHCAFIKDLIADLYALHALLFLLVEVEA